MIERQARWWQQISTALFTFAGSFFAGGLVLVRIEKANEGLVFIIAGTLFFLAALIAARRSLGPKNERWTLARSIYFLATGKLIGNAEAALMIKFENEPADDWDPAIKEKTTERIWREAQSGELWIEGIELDAAKADRIGAPDRINPVWFAAYSPRIRDDCTLHFHDHINSQRRTGRFTGVVIPRDQIRALRMKKIIGL